MCSFEMQREILYLLGKGGGMEPRTPPGSSRWGAGTQVLGLCFTAFPGELARGRVTVELSDIKQFQKYKQHTFSVM